MKLLPLGRVLVEMLEHRTLLAAQAVYIRLNNSPAIGTWMKLTAVKVQQPTAGGAGSLALTYPLNASTVAILKAVQKDTTFTSADLELVDAASGKPSSLQRYKTIAIARVSTSAAETLTESATMDFATSTKLATPAAKPTVAAQKLLNGDYFAELQEPSAVDPEVTAKQQNPIFSISEFSFTLEPNGGNSTLSISKNMDDAGEVFLDDLSGQKASATINLFARSKAVKSSAFAEFTFKRGSVTNVTWSGTSGVALLNEDVSISFASSSVLTSKTASDGTIGTSVGTITPPSSILPTGVVPAQVKPQTALTKLLNAVTTDGDAFFLALSEDGVTKYREVDDFAIDVELGHAGSQEQVTFTFKAPAKAGVKNPVIQNGATFAGGSVLVANAKKQTVLARFNLKPITVTSADRTTSAGKATLDATLSSSTVSLQLFSALQSPKTAKFPKWISLTSPTTTIGDI